MKKIDLTTWERVQLTLAVGSHIPGQGTVAAVRLGCKALDVLEFTEKEKSEIGWVMFPDGRVTWRPNETVWTLEFADDVWGFVKRRVNGYQNWPMGRLTNVLLDKVLEDA